MRIGWELLCEQGHVLRSAMVSLLSVVYIAYMTRTLCASEFPNSIQLLDM